MLFGSKVVQRINLTILWTIDIENRQFDYRYKLRSCDNTTGWLVVEINQSCIERTIDDALLKGTGSFKSSRVNSQSSMYLVPQSRNANLLWSSCHATCGITSFQYTHTISIHNQFSPQKSKRAISRKRRQNVHLYAASSLKLCHIYCRAHCTPSPAPLFYHFTLGSKYRDLLSTWRKFSL